MLILKKLYYILMNKKMCAYCHNEAFYIVAGTKNCCVPRAYSCPGYTKWMGDKLRKKYKEHPERIETQKRVGKEVHNRPEVIEKKRKTMLNLHKNDKKFNENYNKGRKSYRNLVEKLVENGEHWKGSGESYSHYHKIAKEKYYKPRCEKCGCTRQLHNHLYSQDLHMHNINEDFTDLSEDNWITLCRVCHGVMHTKVKEGI